MFKVFEEEEVFVCSYNPKRKLAKQREKGCHRK